MSGGSNPALDWPIQWPSWFDGVYFSDGRGVRVLHHPTAPREGLDGPLRERILQWAARAVDGSELPVTEFTDDLHEESPMIGVRVQCDKQGLRAMTVAAWINRRGLERDVLEPMIALDDGLELVPAEQDNGKATFALSGLMRPWAIRSTQAFLAEQRRIVTGQTITYAGLSLIALLALIGTTWFFIRVARREMALAELKSNFVADVSHELKTPLALIRLYAETLQSGRVNEDAKQQEYYSVITRESTRLTNLINNILDFARIEAGRRIYNFQVADVGSVLRETYEAYRAELDRHNFEHQLRVAPAIPRVNMDRDSIAQILVNLMNNAVKYSGDDRYLLIDVTKDVRRGRRGVLISVEDHGIGIRPEDRARIFEGFFRAADGRVQSKGGTGLGLSLVKHTIEAHGGTMDVESRLVNGTAFRLFLPSADVDGEAKAHPAEASPRAGSSSARSSGTRAK